MQGARPASEVRERRGPSFSISRIQADRLTVHKFGRALQLLGLVILPIAISGNVADRLTLQESLMLSGLGMVVFFVGWSLQQGSRGK